MNVKRFTEFDEYANAIEHVDLNVRLLHPRPRRHFWTLQDVELKSLRLQRAVEGSGIIATGKMHSDGWGLYVQLSGNPISVNGRPIGTEALAVLPPGAEFVFSGHGCVSWFSVFLPKNIAVVDGEPTRFEPSVEVAQLPSKLMKQLYSKLRKCLKNATQTEPESQQSNHLAGLQDELLSAVREVLAIRGSSVLKDSSRGARQRLVSRALELIHDHHEPALRVSELATALGVSERTLLYAFRKQFDISPQEYLISHRLHWARECFRSSGPAEPTVAAVAASCGFYDFGRFAEKYRQLFNEYPSVTLHRATRRGC